jgi:hypothetical protein
MNFTIPARLEDTLVVEITEHEHGACESTHSEGDNRGCTTSAVAIADHCARRDFLVCSAYVESSARKKERHEGKACLECGLPLRDCWSVVMLP